ncbi:acyl carrier protein [Streptomyces sp. ISL-98]|uniref:acyl carrier protein n=1 Tax=Streptomyces sp. ISL-98 TaxID=2819192 RepID=UPI001BE90E0F|nr:acyl carrier protein [Streptomyces sp. ISL-98]MBT2510102.1 acyl carrier protein [Streptomyces sp. ISL-98]
MTQQQNAGYDASYYEEKISEIVTEELELEPGDLTVSGDFIEDYDSDSLALITVVSRIEKELGVALPKEGLEELKTLGDLLAAVHTKLTEALQDA